ncbi:hypothetical protein EM65_011925 [Vibrio parahaemolyticus]|nr:hypothetical protein EM99_009610 [Vibrio parahaemolyticus]OAR33218.1 hypothetical protein EN03_003750 [Vibrio parahaemolyticus]OAR57364.1 hypothetical protein EM49_006320 [Vibrio parahaemolyticus]OAR60537.1 hypothetical protein EM83_009155 [Vibrio parahaemolyticus]OAR68964.1 hypothetical protein EM65_011925 [Vibrio parahaemolyticus]
MSRVYIIYDHKKQYEMLKYILILSEKTTLKANKKLEKRERKHRLSITLKYLKDSNLFLFSKQ